MLKGYYADLHIHVGRTGAGAPVKVTASAALTLPALMEAAAGEKGLDLIGVVDMAVPGVLQDVRRLLKEGTLHEEDGVFHYRSGNGAHLGILAGSEVEVTCGPGRAHFLAYVPGLEGCGEFSRWLSSQVANPHLSTPLVRASFWELREAVSALGGLLIAAHIFTPHRGLLGACGDDADLLRDIVEACDGVELGLSADAHLAGMLPRLREKPWLSASDAHSVGKIAREYSVLRLAKASFPEVALALAGQEGRRVVANYGLDPRLGKYHRTFCPRCGEQASGPPPRLHCPRDRAHPVVRGVLDRIVALAREPGWREGTENGRHRYPAIPYYHQIPLEFVPGVGPRTFRRLMERFGNEMTVLHRARTEELAEVVGYPLAARIDEARRGKAAIAPGGGGTYGRLETAVNPANDGT